ncbi:MAG: sulfoxide reductase heme-binding subunit YedZ [Gammaproteobacteria bacterium]|nr:sulfoxide reductase heme-binding subunit YedZ [Gammaproteobacteria bacterium]
MTRTLYKLAAHLAALMPFAYYLAGAYWQWLGADPQEQILHGMGIWSFYFLLLSLAITPLRRWLGWHGLIHYRRMLGLYFAFYLLLHILVYLWLYLGWRWGEFGSELVKRPYLTLGIAAALLTLPLVATSTQWAQRKLKRRWKQLHKSVYLIVLLAWVHYFWQVKSDLNEPLLYLMIVCALLGYRFWTKFHQKAAGLNKKSPL